MVGPCFGGALDLNGGGPFNKAKKCVSYPLNFDEGEYGIPSSQYGTSIVTDDGPNNDYRA